jgi:hypothetical protein
LLPTAGAGAGAVGDDCSEPDDVAPLAVLLLAVAFGLRFRSELGVLLVLFG